MDKKTIYVSGKITGNANYKSDFEKTVNKLKQIGWEKIISPTCLPDNLEYEQYMEICFAMINVSDTVYCMKNWKESKGARREEIYAIAKGKVVLYEG